MSKLGDPNARTRHGVDESDGQRRNFKGATPYQGGGRGPLKSGPEPGEKGVSRSDGPVGRSTGTSSDLRGKPRSPSR